MEPTSPELDTIADLLRRWQQVDGPMDRVSIVSAAADALRGLSTLDARALAQGLWEHGAGPAAQQVADRMGRDVAPEDLAETASAVLALDRAEVERFAHELRDPEQRRRLLVDSGIAPEEAARHVAAGPPNDQQRIDAPPPPGAETSTAATARPDHPPPEGSGTDPLPGSPGGEPRTSEDPAHHGVEVASPEQGAAAATEPPRTASILPPNRPHVRPDRDTDGGARRLSQRLAGRLHDAPNGRERLRLLDEDDLIIHGTAILRILDAVPDGWQRRTILRKLVTSGRIRNLPADEVVARFSRRGDRFAAAALLVRTGTCSPQDVLPPLDPNDAERLRRRASVLSPDR